MPWFPPSLSQRPAAASPVQKPHPGTDCGGDANPAGAVLTEGGGSPRNREASQESPPKGVRCFSLRRFAPEISNGLEHCFPTLRTLFSRLWCPPTEPCCTEGRPVLTDLQCSPVGGTQGGAGLQLVQSRPVQFLVVPPRGEGSLLAATSWQKKSSHWRETSFFLGPQKTSHFWIFWGDQTNPAKNSMSETPFPHRCEHKIVPGLRGKGGRRGCKMGMSRPVEQATPTAPPSPVQQRLPHETRAMARAL